MIEFFGRHKSSRHAIRVWTSGRALDGGIHRFLLVESTHQPRDRTAFTAPLNEIGTERMC